MPAPLVIDIDRDPGDLQDLGAQFIDLSTYPFTNRDDIVDKGDPLVVPLGGHANSLNGSDRLIGSSYKNDVSDRVSVGIQVTAGGSLVAGNGNDELVGSADSTGLTEFGRLVYGIDVRLGGSYSAGNGNDFVHGIATAPEAEYFAQWLGSLWKTEPNRGTMAL